MEQKDNSLVELKKIINSSNNIVFLGGAGVSTGSGIPDFRSANGLFKEDNMDVPPETILSASFFRVHTRDFYDFYFSKMIYPDAKPNTAHTFLAKLEKTGKLKAVITQNIDGLHELAGSQNVINLHGSVNSNHCLKCRKSYSLDEILALRNKNNIPVCPDCGGIIKPDVTLYGEYLDEGVIEKAQESLAQADTLIVGGTSLEVQPAANLIFSFKGDNIVFINKSPTPLDYLAKLTIRDNIEDVLCNIKIRKSVKDSMIRYIKTIKRKPTELVEDKTEGR